MKDQERDCPLPQLHFAGCHGTLDFTKTLLTTGAFGLALATATPVQSQMVNTVEVRGAQFIPEQDIKATCGAEEGVEYIDLELRAIEDCLMSTGVFETVALSREGDTLVIDVQELDTRPGRIDATLAYASQDGVVGSLSYERYNLFDRTYGAVNLEYGEEVQRYSLNLYRTEAFETDFDLGFELAGGRDDYDDRSYTHESLRIETYLGWALSPSTKLEAGIGYRDHRLYDVEPTASALLLQEQTDGISAPYVRLGLRHERTAEAQDGQEDWDRFGYRIRLDQYFWNIGTDDPISDTRLETRMQFPLASNLRLLFGFDAGNINGTSGNATRAIDRFYPGADTFRGFAPRGIGPRDGNDALGATPTPKSRSNCNATLARFTAHRSVQASLLTAAQVGIWMTHLAAPSTTACTDAAVSACPWSLTWATPPFHFTWPRPSRTSPAMNIRSLG